MTTALSRVVGIQIAALLLTLLASHFFKIALDPQQTLWGAATSGSQVTLLMAVGHRVFNKKGIAITLALSVFKYGILLGIFILASTGKLQITRSFVVGIITILPGLAGLSALKPK